MEETGQAQHLFVSGIVYEDRYYVCRSVYFEKETGKSRFTENLALYKTVGRRNNPAVLFLLFGILFAYDCVLPVSFRMAADMFFGFIPYI